MNAIGSKPGSGRKLGLLLCTAQLLVCSVASAQAFKAQPKEARPDFIPAGYDDYQAMLDQLGIKKTRPGRDGRAKDSTDPAVTYRMKDSLPDLMTFQNGSKLTTVEQWPARRAEIVELFERELYGRVPANASKVTWEDVSTVEGETGGIPIVT